MSILFDILTSDDMQSDASDMLRFLLKREQIGPKSWFFGSFREFFLFMAFYTIWVTLQL